MTNIDLEKYKKVWKNERGFDKENLTETEIYGFIKSASKKYSCSL